MGFIDNDEQQRINNYDEQRFEEVIDAFCEDPDTCQIPETGCTGSCATCGGCH